jgi:hypothetical protein
MHEAKLASAPAIIAMGMQDFPYFAALRGRPRTSDKADRRPKYAGFGL